MQTQTGAHHCSTRTGTSRITGEVRVEGGFPLGERAAGKVLLGDYQFTPQDTYREYSRDGRGVAVEAWGCAGGERPYKLETRAGVVVSCDCDDCTHRRRTCCHMLMLSVAAGRGLRELRTGTDLFFASALLTSPAAIAAAVSERGRAVEAAKRRGLERECRLPARDGAAARRDADGRIVAPGSPCPECGYPTQIDHEPGLRADFLACSDRDCYHAVRVEFDYGLMAWRAA